MEAKEVAEFWEAPESHVRVLDDGSYVLAHRLMFHWMLVRGAAESPEFYDDRYCYQTEEMVLQALASYPQEGGMFEPTGWHRHPPTCRRRPDGDASREYVES